MDFSQKYYHISNLCNYLISPYIPKHHLLYPEQGRMMLGLLWNWLSLSLFLSELTLQQALHQSVFMPCSSPSPSMPHCWDQHSKLLPTVAGITASKVAVWSVDEVHRAPVCICISHLLFKFSWINARFFILGSVIFSCCTSSNPHCYSAGDQVYPRTSRLRGASAHLQRGGKLFPLITSGIRTTETCGKYLTSLPSWGLAAGVTEAF